MTLQQLKYVLCVADNCSISEAAKELYISQPTLSNSIRELEKELSISIFYRTNKGISISSEGLEFLGYARQVVEQTALLEEKYLGNAPSKIHFGVSTQHYAFAVNAFASLINESDAKEYDFTLRETRTFEIIQDVRQMNSEIGILYINEFNRKIMLRMLKENELEFHELFTASPHVFVSKSNPLAKKQYVEIEDLSEYPYLSFEQGSFNSFYFSEEILSTLSHSKTVKVSDRATLFNFLIGINGYTICSGMISEELNWENIVAVPLKITGEDMHIGYITKREAVLSKLGAQYISLIGNSGSLNM